MAEDLLKNLGLSLADIDLFAAAKGPGSFTGVRIGVALIKGLAWATEKPVCGVSSLEALSYNGLSASADSVVCCVMDARRSQVYNALFEIAGGLPKRLSPDRAVSLDELEKELASLQKSIFLVGDGAELCYNAWGNSNIPLNLAPENIRFQSAWGVCRAAQGSPAVSAAELIPSYLRLSQAERERQAKLTQDKT
jgi:tRNA threonylcarbamoyladenosine biosynthesis protein TsaB